MSQRLRVGTLLALLGLVMPFWLGTAMLSVGLSDIAFWGRLAFVLLLFGLPCIALASGLGAGQATTALTDPSCTHATWRP